METPLRRWRIAAGLSQVTLAERCGIKQNTVSRYERGEHIPIREHLERLLQVTGLPTDALVRPERFLAEHPDFLAQHPASATSKRGRPLKG